MGSPDSSEARKGAAFAVACYLIWALTPIFWKALVAVPAWEILAHRVVWSVVLLWPLLYAYRRGALALATFANRRALVPLLASTVLISVNWFFFIWGVNEGRVLEVSLGYYINPLVNVLLGVVVLRERLRPWQALAVCIAAAGVLNQTLSLGLFPWLSLTLAGTFGFYGLLRKVMPADALVGLTVETTLMAPVAVGFLVLFWADGHSAAPSLDAWHLVLLFLTGVITAVPLWFFTEGARRLRYATLGLLQYLAPTGHFLLALWVFDEPFSAAHLFTFACIWTALIMYSWDARRAHRATLAALKM